MQSGELAKYSTGKRGLHGQEMSTNRTIVTPLADGRSSIQKQVLFLAAVKREKIISRGGEKIRQDVCWKIQTDSREKTENGAPDDKDVLNQSFLSWQSAHHRSWSTLQFPGSGK